ncbi:hypothetical protein BS78_08G093200 [Paspalum vaginatum]|nr:hypothetical protein BS78_08G093200 [Paspalum vaginatum]
MSLVGEHMDIKLDLLETITNKFSADLRIGSGGYGDVYRGVYNGEEIAVKKLHPLQGLDDKTFDNEFGNLREIRHQNVVRLIGYCHEARRKFIEHNGQLVWAQQIERALCFEYMPGGSLDKYISDNSCDLDWPTCYKIIKGICEGLNHLHTVRSQRPIFHMDLKPANILLDNNKTAKIGDLGLSRIVASSQTHKTRNINGTHGYMPPEYLEDGSVSNKFDVFCLGVIIVKILAGNKGYDPRNHEKDPDQFIKFVTGSWKERLLGTSGYSLSQEICILQVKTCADIALRCVKAERKERPQITDIVDELKNLEAQIKKMSQTKDVIGLQRISNDSNVLSVDPTLELRFPFELRKDISCCLQLINKTCDSMAFNIKIDQTKYSTEPNKGIMKPCSRLYVSATLRAQEEAPPNMQCRDMFIVQCVNVREAGLASADDEITEDFFEKVMAEKVVDVLQLPIVYVPRRHFSRQ